MAAYAGTTFALEGISESLRRELLIFGVDVIVIAPQSTNTPLIDKAEAQDPAPYESTPYREMIKHVLDFVVVEGRKGYMPEHIAKFVKLALVVKKTEASLFRCAKAHRGLTADPCVSYSPSRSHDGQTIWLDATGLETERRRRKFGRGDEWSRDESKKHQARVRPVHLTGSRVGGNWNGLEEQHVPRP
jgi:hypothetical protein